MPEGSWCRGRVAAGLLIVLLIAAAALFRIVNYTNGTLISAGVEREYYVHVPASYDPSTPTPLVIALHGYGQLPIQQNSVSRWSDLADEEGFIVVYPAGTYFPLRWQTGGAYEQLSDPRWDIAFIADLIDAMGRTYNIDPARVYANGFSNGGGASFILSCALSERIAAVGMASGAYLYTWGDCQPARQVPAIVFHGTADDTVPYAGGEAGVFRVQFPAIPGWVDTLAQRNGCEGTHELASAGEVRALQYTGCEADVLFYTIAEGEHAWPQGDAYRLPGAAGLRDPLDATRAMWAFFQAHPLGGETGSPATTASRHLISPVKD